ncbi:hypothetical protein L9F63_023577 [Diploptera punctata]|uniref:Ninjurin-2 n=1 Tax=Diploptera punctata TaxID=6984 RepID=A0AAD7ZIW8_DIPPU|nr:hypothetical protein L9F63_023577 [Diploptera punctata]
MGSTYNQQENTNDEKNQNDFNHNGYATRKTITQGFLDVALLVSNAAQFKYVLDFGDTYQHYVLMITLLSVSLVLQLVRGCLNVVLGSLYNISQEDHQKAATILNNIVLLLGVFTTLVNAIISGFDMSEKYDQLEVDQLEQAK